MLNNNFKPLKDYPNLYFIDDKGNLSNGRKLLKPYVINSGYKAYRVNVKGVRKSYLIHRLVAEAFVPNPNNYPIVNHIDGDKLNNEATNLEWCTNSHNILEARRLGLNPYNNPTKGLKIGKASKYYNVTYDKNRNKWKASIRSEGKNLEQKRFNTEEEAALHVNIIIDKYGLDRPKNII